LCSSALPCLLIVTSKMCAFLEASTTWPTFQLPGLYASQKKAVAHPTGSKLLETVGSKVVEMVKAKGIELKQTYAKEGQWQGYKAGRYAHDRQFKRVRKVIKRQRTIVGRLQLELGRRMTMLIKPCKKPCSRPWTRPNAWSLRRPAAKR
jgi:hypothetical protein